MESKDHTARPRIVLGVDEFADCVEAAKRVGRWEAWTAGYFERFRGAFQPMLDFVYQCDLEEIRPYVEALDVDAALRSARRFVAEGGVERVRAAFDRCIETLPPAASFPVFLIVGIGHANGMALPAAEPYVFLGLERISHLDDLDALIAHEYNHLVRVQAFHEDIDPLSMTIGDFAVSEGLATVFSLWLLGRPIVPEAIAACISNLGDPQAALGREPEYRAELLAHWDRPSTREMIDRFIGTGTAYLVGGLAICRLLETGLDVLDLTRTAPQALNAMALESLRSPRRTSGGSSYPTPPNSKEDGG